MTRAIPFTKAQIKRAIAAGQFQLGFCSSHYTRTADRRKLARGAMHKLMEQ